MHRPFISWQKFLSFCDDARVWRTDRQTDRRILTAISRCMQLQRGKNWTNKNVVRNIGSPTAVGPNKYDCNLQVSIELLWIDAADFVYVSSMHDILLLSGASVVLWQTSTARALGRYGWTRWGVSVTRRHWAAVRIMDGASTTVHTLKTCPLPALEAAQFAHGRVSPP